MEKENIVQNDNPQIAEFEARETLRKSRRKKGLIAGAIALVIVIFVAIMLCYTEGVGSKTIVGGYMGTKTSEDADILSSIKTDNIKYQNPVAGLIDIVFGKNKESVAVVNGTPVSENVFNFATNSAGINCVYTFMQNGMISTIDGFDWETVDQTTGLSYKELSKGMALDMVAPIYAVIGEGEKRGIVITEDEEKEIRAAVAQQKAQYGDQFEEILKKNGYANEETLYEMQKINVHLKKIYQDISKNPDSYITEQMKKKAGDDKVTVTHILVKFEEDDKGNIIEEKKADAKKEAEEVLAKVNKGEDFDKLIAEYNDDPGLTTEGYTFANDGTMVQEFADAAFALEVGATSNIVETSYGYHIIKRLERAITPDDYVEILADKVPIKIKKGVYDKINITIDLNDYFGQAEETPQNTEPIPAE